MKKLFGLIILTLFTFISEAQVTYYEGEWTVKSRSDLFKCIVKLDIKNTDVTAEFAWTFIAIDNSNSELAEYYKNKKGNSGIEYTEGEYSQETGDIDLVAVKLDDPKEILGMTKYMLKLSADKKVIHGSTTGLENDDPGLFYAVAVKNSDGAKKFDALVKTVKK